MKPSKPPVVATWLLEHLLPENKGEVLAGDLLERFNQNHSAARYWREVLAAIFIAHSKRLAILWIALGFTAAWISALFLYQGHLWLELIKLPWTDSIIDVTGFFTVIHALPLPVAVGLFLAIDKKFTTRRMLIGMLVGLVTLIFCSSFFNVFLWMHLNAHPLAGFITMQSVDLFSALTVAMWVGQLKGLESRRPVTF